MPSFKANILNAIHDVSQAYIRKSVWTALAWNDVKNRYNRSKLGGLWAGLSLLIFVSVLGPIYSSLIGVEIQEYVAHLLLGFIVWNYVSGIIMECGREYVNSVNYLVSFQLSYFTLLFRVIWRNLVVLGYQMIVFVFFVIVFQYPLSIEWTIAPLALTLITLNALWIGLLISIFATRYRDLDELLNNIIRLAFFATPIIWMPHLNSTLTTVAELNPIYHLIEIFREPLLSGEITWYRWAITAAISVIGWTVAFPIFAKYRSRIAFWL